MRFFEHQNGYLHALRVSYNVSVRTEAPLKLIRLGVHMASFYLTMNITKQRRIMTSFISSRVI